MRIGIVVSYFVLSLSPAFSVCPTGNNLANSAYVAEIVSSIGLPQSVASTSLYSFSEKSMSLATFRFESTPTTGTNTAGFSAANFTSNYGATLFNGRITALTNINVDALGNVDNSINATPSTPTRIYYTYNAGIRAPLWEGSSNTALSPSANRVTYPSTCFIYIWVGVPSTTAPFSPPDAIAVVGNSGAEIIGQQVRKFFNDAYSFHQPEAVRFRALRQ